MKYLFVVLSIFAIMLVACDNNQQIIPTQTVSSPNCPTLQEEKLYLEPYGIYSADIAFVNGCPTSEILIDSEVKDEQLYKIAVVSGDLDVSGLLIPKNGAIQPLWLSDGVPYEFSGSVMKQGNLTLGTDCYSCIEGKTFNVRIFILQSDQNDAIRQKWWDLVTASKLCFISLPEWGVEIAHINNQSCDILASLPSEDFIVLLTHDKGVTVYLNDNPIELGPFSRYDITREGLNGLSVSAGDADVLIYGAYQNFLAKVQAALTFSNAFSIGKEGELMNVTPTPTPMPTSTPLPPNV